MTIFIVPKFISKLKDSESLQKSDCKYFYQAFSGKLVGEKIMELN